jgi:ATP-binding cassette, subfamily B, bacterial PglK
MQSNQNIITLLKRVWHHFSLLRRWQFRLLLILMLLTSFAEILSIGAVIPFLAALTVPERIFELSALQPVIHVLKITEPEQLVLPLTIAFGASAVIAGSMRLLLLWVSTKLSYAAGADLSISIYRRTLYQPYAVHCARNSSEIISGISTKTEGVISVISMVLTFISSMVMLITILFALLSIEPLITLATFAVFGLIYFVLIRMTRKQLSINGELMALKSTQVIKSLQEGLGGIRDVLIDGSQDAYCKIYRNADLPLRRAQGNSSFVAASPRYALESLGMVIIAAAAYFFAQQSDGIAKVIPLLGALALGAQRLLPVLQHAYGAWASIRAFKPSLEVTLVLLDQPLPDYFDQPVAKPLPFKNNISIKQLCFRYDEKTPFMLKNLNLSIGKGSRVGFIGTTGSGKSTLLDIIMGLLIPTDGSLEVDGKAITSDNLRAWQSHIAHVPQVIFLSDSTIEENIAFGVPKDQINLDRVRKAAQQAQIAENIESWPQKYQTFVGERGVRLSGGQRQRIGIARALYKHADVIIFDEATSALDNETEQAVMQVIEDLSEDLTLLIIAHRLTTLKNCTQVVEMVEGGIRSIGSYTTLVNSSKLSGALYNEVKKI